MLDHSRKASVNVWLHCLYNIVSTLMMFDLEVIESYNPLLSLLNKNNNNVINILYSTMLSDIYTRGCGFSLHILV